VRRDVSRFVAEKVLAILERHASRAQAMAKRVLEP